MLPTSKISDYVGILQLLRSENGKYARESTRTHEKNNLDLGLEAVSAQVNDNAYRP